MKKKTLFRFLPCIVMMMVIFCFSAMPATESEQTSRMVADPIANILNWLFGGKVDPALYETVNGVIRKMAHAAEYGVLAVTAVYAVYGVWGKRWKCFLTAQALCTFYAVTDELHQFFVPGRHASLKDVVIDSLGALCGILCCALFLRLRKGCSKRGNT